MTTQPEIKDKPLTTLVPVIKSPELIKVKTINPRIAEALEYQHENFDWTNQEIIGRIVPHGILTRHIETGEISKVGSIVYIQARAKQLEEQGSGYTAANRLAQDELKTIPQIFPT